MEIGFADSAIAVSQQQRCMRLWTIVGYVRHVAIVILADAALRLATVAGEVARVSTWTRQIKHHSLFAIVAPHGLKYVVSERVTFLFSFVMCWQSIDLPVTGWYGTG